MRNAIIGAVTALKSVAGVAVTYERGTGSVSVTAVPGRTEYETTDVQGYGIMAVSRDFLIRCSELVIDSEEITPEAGDTITEGTGTYEVSDAGGEVWRYSDPYRTVYRIHTKEVE